MRIRKASHRRLIAVVVILVAIGVWVVQHPDSYRSVTDTSKALSQEDSTLDQNLTVSDEQFLATSVLNKLQVHDKDLSRDYDRNDFYDNWGDYNGCDMRNVILQRDLTETVLDGCIVQSGTLEDPYTGKTINFVRGQSSSSAVQIDHVVSLSDAWTTGAQDWDEEKRYALSQDPLNLLAVDGPENQRKSDGDASEWLPPNEAFQCQYVARQISVKYKYSLWVTSSEKDVMLEVLEECPNETTLGLENLEAENLVP